MDEKKIPVEFHFSPTVLDTLEKLKKDTNAESLGSVLGTAIYLYAILHDQVNDNFKIQAVKKNGLSRTIREISIP